MTIDLVPLPAGTVAPAFTLHQTRWMILSLRRLAGRPTILVFYPTPFEPVSCEQLTLFQEFLPQVEVLGGQLVGISADHTWCHEAFAREAGVSFPLLSDMHPRGAVSRLYGVYREDKEVTGRALFVIDGGGFIRFSQAYPDLLNPGVNDVLTVLERVMAEADTRHHPE
ncbi:MAG: redoxin domain-containing protein [Chloroflexi bacterium]|nr:redoxin domain-containing protein [Chloroflexota bacterium]